MAQTSFHLDRVAHKQLEVEKFGVIAGFLLGLPLAVGVVSDVLVAQGAPDFLVALGVVMTMAHYRGRPARGCSLGSPLGCSPLNM